MHPHHVQYHAMQVFDKHGRAPIKAWVDGVPVEPEALQQLRNIASLPFIRTWRRCPTCTSASARLWVR
jgi:hypothetical protein